jgi:hypothetical protein
MRKFPRRRMRSILINFGSVNDDFLKPAEEDGDWDLLAEFFDQGGYHRVTKEMGEFLSSARRNQEKEGTCQKSQNKRPVPANRAIC